MAERKATEQEQFMKKKLYDVVFTLDPKYLDEKVEQAALVGEFLFYRSNLKGNTDEEGMVEGDEKIPPAKYEKGMSQIGGYYYHPMAFEEKTGQFTVTLRLPAGHYPYSFCINDELVAPLKEPEFRKPNLMTEDGTYHSLKKYRDWVSDPKNPPHVPSQIKGGNPTSVRYVGNPDDMPWLPAVNPAVKGTLTYTTYKDLFGDDRNLGVYLPARYDRRGEYPLIFLCHGGGGNEAEWYSQGGLDNIMDNLIASKKTEEAVVVTMNNGVYDWEFPIIAQNLLQCILPTVQKLFAVTNDSKRMAFCGLSMGSMTTLYTYMHHPERFQYFGAFSGGLAGGEEFTLANPKLREVTLMIGCAEEDIAYNERDIGIPSTIRALKEKELPFIPYFVPGSHDWFCWPAMFTHFAEHILWK